MSKTETVITGVFVTMGLIFTFLIPVVVYAAIIN